jgi:hydroxyacyl-ACP dehydratase HTD2-like protein with hotdog domain
MSEDQKKRPSDQISNAVTQGIENTIVELGGMLVGYEAFVSFIDNQGRRMWATAYMDGQTPMATIGFLHYHTMIVETHEKHLLELGWRKPE